jgi:LuxR family maltose regulon positive regulatory protein
VLAHAGEHDAARSVVAGLMPLLSADTPQWWQVVWVLLVTTETQLEICDIEGAERTVARARREISSRKDPGVLPERLALVQSAVGLRLMPEPLSPSELRVLAELPEEMSLSQIAHAIYLSRNTVKTHVRSIYRKLGVGSREEAVEVGRDLGLLA